jgi:hypothetical protein
MTSGLAQTAAPLATRALADKPDGSGADPAADIQDVTEFNDRYAAMIGRPPGTGNAMAFRGLRAIAVMRTC